MRELREETGIEGRNWVALGSHSPNPANHNNRVHIFGCRVHQFLDADQDETEEIDSWFATGEELSRLVIEGDFDQQLHLGTLYKAMLCDFWEQK